MQFLFVLITVLLLLGILALFITKAGLQLQYLRLQKDRPKGAITDFFQFDFSDKKERALRWQAFLLFPMLYAVVLDDNREELNDIKRKIKRIHIAIYFSLIILVILAIYSEKVFI